MANGKKYTKEVIKEYNIYLLQQRVCNIALLPQMLNKTGKIAYVQTVIAKF
jgi:hypothetical protein